MWEWRRVRCNLHKNGGKLIYPLIMSPGSQYHCYWMGKSTQIRITSYSLHCEALFRAIYIKTWKLRVPKVAQQKKIWLASMRMRVPSLAWLSGLRIQLCCELWYVTDKARIPSCCGCGVGRQLWLWFNL